MGFFSRIFEKKFFLLLGVSFLDTLFINHVHQVSVVLYDLHRTQTSDLKSEFIIQETEYFDFARPLRLSSIVKEHCEIIDRKLTLVNPSVKSRRAGVLTPKFKVC